MKIINYGTISYLCIFMERDSLCYTIVGFMACLNAAIKYVKILFWFCFDFDRLLKVSSRDPMSLKLFINKSYHDEPRIIIL